MKRANLNLRKMFLIRLNRYLTMALVLFVSCFFGGEQGEARVTQIEVLEKTSPVFDGKTFGNVGAYERIFAKVHYAVDPKARNLAQVVDLDKAPRNTKGEVEFSADTIILRPVDATKGNGTMLYEVPNRGRNISVVTLNDTSSFTADPITAEQAGNGYLMNQGYTVVLSGWQTGVKGVKLYAPVATGTQGHSREEFIFDKDEAVSKKKLSYPASDLDVSKATLTVRVNESDPRKSVPGLSFKYLSPTEVEITRPADLSAGAIYELIYPAKDSLVSGLGFVAIRDTVAWLKGLPGHDPKPMVKAQYAIGIGLSQSGRCLRDFIYQGFNSDDNGKKVFDGTMIHIAGSRKTYVNYRFAQPGRFSRQHEDHSFPGDQFPFTYAKSTDPLTGRTDSVLMACRKNNTCPKVMHSDTTTEFWQARASLMVTDPSGKPLDMPGDVRLFHITGTQHFSVAGAKPKAKKPAQFLDNPPHVGVVLRALLASMKDWITQNVQPPASRFPNLKDGTLIAPDKAMQAQIPGLTFKAVINELAVMDHSALPPKAGKTYPVFVPKSNGDGNDVAGVMLPHMAVPLATHLGWNPRTTGYSQGELYTTTGSYIPFPKTKAQAEADRDSRLPVDQRYKSESDYLAKVKAVAKALVADRLVLAQDEPLLIERAKQEWQELHK